MPFLDIFCEKADYNSQTDLHSFIFDFSADYNLSHLSLNIPLNLNSEHASLFTLDNVLCKDKKHVVEGCWYSIPSEFLIQHFTLESITDERSLFLFSGNQKTSEELNFSQYLDSHHLFNYSKYSSPYQEKIDNQPEKSRNNWELTVYDVGCGNCNLLNISSSDNYSNNLIFYDLGADLRAKSSEIQKLLDRIRFQNPFSCILSHWDLDHYRLILDMDIASLNNLNYFIAPSMIPNTQKVSNVFNRLNSINAKIFILPKNTVNTKKISLNSIGYFKGIELYRSRDAAISNQTKKLNLNQSGIVILVEGPSKKAVLCGDHHYSQIYDAIFNHHSYAEKPFEFVVPHHGGQAGSLDTIRWGKIPFSGGAISTLENRYRNIPQQKVHDFFVIDKKFHCTESRCSSNKPNDYQVCL